MDENNKLGCLVFVLGVLVWALCDRLEAKNNELEKYRFEKEMTQKVLLLEYNGLRVVLERKPTK